MGFVDFSGSGTKSWLLAWDSHGLVLALEQAPQWATLNCALLRSAFLLPAWKLHQLHTFSRVYGWCSATHLTRAATARCCRMSCWVQRCCSCQGETVTQSLLVWIGNTILLNLLHYTIWSVPHASEFSCRYWQGNIIPGWIRVFLFIILLQTGNDYTSL